jgi:hypothetical protein
MKLTIQAATQARVARSASMRSSRQCRVMASSVETAAQRYARAAAKYRTGPRSNTMYTPPKLLFNTDIEDLNLKDQVSHWLQLVALGL